MNPEVRNILVNMREIREKKDLHQSDIAKALGITQQAYSKIEAGETEITLTQASKVAEALGLSLGQLVSANVKVEFKIEGDNNQNTQHYQGTFYSSKDHIADLRRENEKLWDMLKSK